MRIKITSKYLNHEPIDWYNIEEQELEQELDELKKFESTDGSGYYEGCRVYADGKLVLDLEEAKK